jgi:hypothetical protein
LKFILIREERVEIGLGRIKIPPDYNMTIKSARRNSFSCLLILLNNFTKSNKKPAVLMNKKG